MVGTTRQHGPKVENLYDAIGGWAGFPLTSNWTFFTIRKIGPKCQDCLSV